MKDKMKPNFGNWVPKKLLALLFITTLAIAILLCLAVFLDWLMPITFSLAVLLCISLFFSCYMMAFHHAFSFDGGGMMGKVHEFVVSRLPWDGHGRLHRQNLRFTWSRGFFVNNHCPVSNEGFHLLIMSSLSGSR